MTQRMTVGDLKGKFVDAAVCRFSTSVFALTVPALTVFAFAAAVTLGGSLLAAPPEEAGEPEIVEAEAVAQEAVQAVEQAAQAIEEAIVREIVIQPQAAAFDIQIEEFNAQPTKEQLAQQRSAYRREMGIRMDELVDVCDLSDAQMKKLTVGIEGIIEKLVAPPEPAPNRAQAAVQAGEVVAAGQVIELIGEAPVQLRGNVRIANRAFVGAAPRWAAVAQPATGPRMKMLWKDLALKVLDDPQEEKWNAATTARAKHIRKTQVASLVQLADAALFLNQEQRGKLTALLDEHVGGIYEKAARFETPLHVNVNMVRKIPDEQLKQVLTENQFDKAMAHWSEPPVGGRFNAIDRNWRNIQRLLP